MSDETSCYYCKDTNITNFYKDKFCSKSCFNHYTIEQLFFNNIRRKHFNHLKDILLDNTCSCSSLDTMNMKNCPNCERYICVKCCTRPCFICSLEEENEFKDHGCKLCLTQIKYKDTDFIILLCNNCNTDYENGDIEF